ncbi:unnamed protein product [Sphagnum balticum]
MGLALCTTEGAGHGRPASQALGDRPLGLGAPGGICKALPCLLRNIKGRSNVMGARGEQQNQQAGPILPSEEAGKVTDYTAIEAFYPVTTNVKAYLQL